MNTILFLAEEEGFEPTRDLHLLSVFETDPFSLLGIPPKALYYITILSNRINKKITVNLLQINDLNKCMSITTFNYLNDSFYFRGRNRYR